MHEFLLSIQPAKGIYINQKKPQYFVTFSKTLI